MNEKLLDAYRKKILNVDSFAERDIFSKLIKEIEKTNSILRGLRGVGKTILAQQLAKDYLESNKNDSSMTFLSNMQRKGNKRQKIQSCNNR